MSSQAGIQSLTDYYHIIIHKNSQEKYLAAIEWRIL